MIGSIVVGDINIWHKKWLKHSPADTLEGERLHSICKVHGLKQLVSEPTRGLNLLDFGNELVERSGEGIGGTRDRRP